MEGYSASPEEQSVRLSRAATSKSLDFTLQKAIREEHAFTVQTSPVTGRIFVDDMAVGEGTAKCEREYGTYTVTFGDVEGWRTPAPMRVTLTPTQPKNVVKAQYTRLFHAFAEVIRADSVSAVGVDHWSTGVIFEKGKLEPSHALGPKIKELSEGKKFAWELGMGDPNHNPTGGDYVIFSVPLPEDVSPDTPLRLRLYLYKSEQRYPFSLAARSEVVVEVNGRTFLDGYAPKYETASADAEHYDEWPLQYVLAPGLNQIVIYTGVGNTVFNYLWKVEIL
jgi:hypothetical protein